VPIVFTSVLEKQRIHKAMELAIQVYTEPIGHNASHEQTERCHAADHRAPTAAHGEGASIRIKYVYPACQATCRRSRSSQPSAVHQDSYARFLENKLREHFDFTGVPIRVFFRKK
jgi:GTP-binding protein